MFLVVPANVYLAGKMLLCGPVRKRRKQEAGFSAKSVSEWHRSVAP